MDPRAVLLVFFCFPFVNVRSEVQKDFSEECRKFMYMGTPPRGLESRYLKKICQRYNGKPRYVTLYDVVDHIPVYSAYTFKRSDGSKKVDVPWMFEPQVTSSLVVKLCQTFKHFNQQLCNVDTFEKFTQLQYRKYCLFLHNFPGQNTSDLSHTVTNLTKLLG